MGKYFIDEFSLLHFATGIVIQYWGVTFRDWFIMHLLFEIVENTNVGVKFIDNYITFWPGGKKQPDTFVNSLGDQIFALLGWLFAKELRSIF